MAQPLDKTLLLSDTVAFLFDCDGVIWRGDHLIEGASVCLSLDFLFPFLAFLHPSSLRTSPSFLSLSNIHPLNTDSLAHPNMSC